MPTVIMKPYIRTPEDQEVVENKDKFFAELFEMLRSYPLDRDFGDDHFMQPRPVMVTDGQSHEFNSDNGQLYTIYRGRNLPKGVWCFGGNFLGYSYAFIVYTDEPELIEQFTAIIRANTSSPRYLKQEKPRKTYYRTDIVGPVIEDWVGFLTDDGCSENYRLYGEDGKLVKVKETS